MGALLRFQMGGVLQFQMGGVLRYKREVYCGISLSSRLRSQQGTALQMGCVLRYKLKVYRQYFSDKLYGLGVPKQSAEIEEENQHQNSREPKHKLVGNFLVRIACGYS